jgi:uncharacterized protein
LSGAVMTEEEARRLLASFVGLEETWGAHSVAVSSAAGTIADALRNAGVAVDPALARVGGLLHDIGRSVTHDFSGHAWAGYELLRNRGFPALARFCTCHQLAGMSPDEATIVGWQAADYRPRSWEEKAVTIADSLAAGDRLVLIADRCADVRERYRGTIPAAHYALLLGVEPKVRALMAEVEAVIGQPVETLCGATPLRH